MFVGVPGTTDHLEFRSLNSAGWSQWYDLTITTAAASASAATQPAATSAMMTSNALAASSFTDSAAGSSRMLPSAANDQKHAMLAVR